MLAFTLQRDSEDTLKRELQRRQPKRTTSGDRDHRRLSLIRIGPTTTVAIGHDRTDLSYLSYPSYLSPWRVERSFADMGAQAGAWVPGIAAA